MITVETHERADELRSRVERRLVAQGQRAGDLTVETRSHRPWLTKQVSISMTSGVRMGAKLALAFGSEVFDEDWRLSDGAVRLREWLWSNTPRTASGEVLAWVPASTDDHPFADPPNHVAYFLAMKGSIAVSAENSSQYPAWEGC